MEVLKPRIVCEQQFGIIAPQKDPNHVNRLVTRGVLSCFAIGLTDAENGVGILAHLAFADNAGPVVRKVIPSMKRLGATHLQVATMGYTVCPPGERPWRMKIMDRLLLSLTRQGLQIDGDWEDLRYGYKAILDIETGLRVVQSDFECLEGVTSFQLLEEEAYNRRIENFVRNSGLKNVNAFKISCAYRPKR